MAATTASRSDHPPAWLVDRGLGWPRACVVKWVCGLFTRSFLDFLCPSPLEKERTFFGFFCLFLPASYVSSLGYVGTLHVVNPEVLSQSSFQSLLIVVCRTISRVPSYIQWERLKKNESTPSCSETRSPMHIFVTIKETYFQLFLLKISRIQYVFKNLGVQESRSLELIQRTKKNINLKII